MIIGTGIDIVQNKRIAKIFKKFGEKFSKKIMGDKLWNGQKANSTNLSACFASKEAFVKALGTGFTNSITFHNIDIMHNSQGKPYIKLTGEANKLSKKLNITNIHLSISHEREYTVAMVILEK